MPEQIAISGSRIESTARFLAVYKLISSVPKIRLSTLETAPQALTNGSFESFGGEK